MHPNGQIPAYEFAFGDVNPPVHAWAVLARLQDDRRARPARPALPRARLPEAAAQLHLVGEPQGRRGADTSSPAASSASTTSASSTARKPLPTGGHLEQADGTAWMAFYCATMLSMALELAEDDPAYEDIASKFFEHFVAIADAMNTLGGTGLWDESDGFYYDQLHTPTASTLPLRVRSMVGLIPLFAVEVLDDEVIERLPGFAKRMRLVPREPAGPGPPHLLHATSTTARTARPPAARHPVARAARARAALPARRERVPLAVRHPLALARPRGAALRLPRRRPASTGSTTCPASPTPGSSAATRTGAGRSGSRSTTC